MENGQGWNWIHVLVSHRNGVEKNVLPFYLPQVASKNQTLGLSNKNEVGSRIMVEC
ncbi:hypothetical protein QO200_10725 [Flavobacterium sp. Arc3]|jgi:hypothetical protein|uniref:hypothetical protein n=1 Tax=Flavobacterium sp. Arc3 TaxID=3046686 RepID=UPI00352FD952